MKKVNVLKVAGHSCVSSVAGSIVKSIEEGKEVELSAIGASAVNQTCKAIASARGLLAYKSLDLLIRPGFKVVEIEGKEVTTMIFKIVIQ